MFKYRMKYYFFDILKKNEYYYDNVQDVNCDFSKESIILTKIYIVSIKVNKNENR
jgi:hypothetical protein